jgi:carbon-monoxide dehydrogenase medium subunit
MKLRLANPAVIVDLNAIPGLSYTCEEDERLTIGALTRHSDVEESEIVQSRFPMIVEAVTRIGDAQVRNLGTVAGSLVHGDPNGDWGPVFLALGGEVRCVGPEGERLVEGPEFFTDMYETARQPTEIVTQVRLRLPRPGAGGAYLKLERRSGDFAVVGVAVYLVLEGNGLCRDVGIGLSGVGPAYLKAAKAESVLQGNRLSESTVGEAADCLGAEIDPYSDVRAPAEYKRAMAKVFFRKALELAQGRAMVRDSDRHL